jgi:alkylhydroperoxidase family enzyme
MSKARIPDAKITGVMGYAAKRFSKKKLGEVPESLGVMWHSKGVLMALMGVARKAERWDHVDAQLKSFAHMAAVAKVGCGACLDFGYLDVHNRGLDEAKASQVPRWRESDVFTPLERDVLEYAEAMTDTPATVTDELSARLLEQVGAPGLLELTAWIGMANLVSRSNTAHGIESQGFSKVCLLPLAQPSAAPTSDPPVELATPA